MLAASIPPHFNTPFASGAGSGFVRSIPVPSQIAITPGAASFTDGFPPLNFTPVSSGGIPPAGADFNGILNQITRCVQWLQTGGWPQYDATLSAAIGGYAAGSVLLAASGTAFWISSVDNNTSNPDAGGANWSVLGIPSTVPWSSVTGHPTLLSQFTNDVGFLGIMSLNSIGYVAFIVEPGGTVYGTEGNIVSLPGRPGTWLINGAANASADIWTVATRVA